MAPGVKSGATLRIGATGITMSAAFRGWTPGFETAILMFLICCAPCAQDVQSIGMIHNVVKNLFCIRFQFSPVVVTSMKKTTSGWVVFPARREGIDYPRILDRGSAALQAAARI